MWCDNLSQEEWEEKYDGKPEMEYLHGICNQWVDSHKRDNDRFIVISDYDVECEHEYLVHCLILRDGKYVDVRGETNDFDKVIDSFDYFDYEVETYDSYDAFHHRVSDILAA